MFGTTNPRYYQTKAGKVPSVTTILSLLDKPFLKKWAANCAVEYIDDILFQRLETEEPIMGNHEMFDKARTSYKQLSMEAADYGTYIHTLCEVYFKGQKIESPHEPTQKLMTSFYAWCKKHNVKPIETETVVYGDGYAGRVDLICEIDSFWKTKGWCKKNKVEWYKGINKQRVITLIDFKTGKGSYYPEWALQTAGYITAWNMSHLDNMAQIEQCARHHGVLKFNKETNRVNYKDMTPTHDRDLKAFLLLRDFWWLTNEGEK